MCNQARCDEKTIWGCLLSSSKAIFKGSDRKIRSNTSYSIHPIVGQNGVISFVGSTRRRIELEQAFWKVTVWLPGFIKCHLFPSRKYEEAMKKFHLELEASLLRSLTSI